MIRLLTYSPQTFRTLCGRYLNTYRHCSQIILFMTHICVCPRLHTPLSGTCKQSLHYRLLLVRSSYIQEYVALLQYTGLDQYRTCCTACIRPSSLRTSTVQIVYRRELLFSYYLLSFYSCFNRLNCNAVHLMFVTSCVVTTVFCKFCVFMKQ